MHLFRGLVLLFWVCSFSSWSAIPDEFSQLHVPWIGQLKPCTQYPLIKIAVNPNAEPRYYSTQVCATELRNDGNAPFILGHAQPTQKLIVLFHGLSDSPYYMRSIAQTLHAQGHTVVVGLLPGHGVLAPLDVLHDSHLASIWRQYVKQVIATVRPLGQQLYLGGFSTGGALATDYMLDNLASVDGLMLYSAALRLSDNAETLAKLPFAKGLSKLIDGKYSTDAINPFKYPEVSNHAALILMDIIREIRTRLAGTTGINIPIFAAHSQSDQVTPLLGIKELINVAIAPHTIFEIDESMHVCHANLPLNQTQVTEIGLDDPNPLSTCEALKANPVHKHMMAMAANFVAQ